MDPSSRLFAPCSGAYTIHHALLRPRACQRGCASHQWLQACRALRFLLRQ